MSPSPAAEQCFKLITFSGTLLLQCFKRIAHLIKVRSQTSKIPKQISEADLAVQTVYLR